MIDLSAIQTDFLNYVQIDTRSDVQSTQIPTTPGQTELAQLLVQQLQVLGMSDVQLNPTNGFVTATLPSNTTQTVPSIGWIAHLDTADFAASPAHPQVHPHYDGRPIVFANGLVLSTERFPDLKRYLGETLITTDGQTLLGADDKAGIAGAIGAVRTLLAHPELSHGMIKLAFGPDEEIGQGADHFDAADFATDFAYTLDNGALGQIEYETFNAAQATITIQGTAVHPGEAKGLMVNALTIAQAIDRALPQFERPEFTSDYEGFYLLDELQGTVDRATMTYIIRDFDATQFAARQATLVKIVTAINAQFGAERIKMVIKSQYANMATIINQNRYPVTLAERAIRAVGLTPKIVPFRGGTDGSKISFQGIPTPNLFNGGMNFHGPFEVVSTEAIGKLAETLVAIATMNLS
ncbi:peptidase T [Lacticaseibacillus brantae]|uniref:Peptidase T n=1 Tax=Lacticaseibacillus brantae DSM 23927 TaxID=1423727 RepID=A0A0R2B5D1_9LACO|nr:peptidase T [Lacticaseibacillus brantae]KRM71659.1 tripeptide aminopeptidase [Lacticaseibacillus brantae DSM 23927]